MAILLNFEDPIEGNSNIDGHGKWIVCDSISFGISRSIMGTGTDRNTGTSSVADVSVSKVTDSSSPEIALQAALGKSRKLATIHYTQTAGDDSSVQIFQELKLHDAVISGYSQSASGEGHPYDNFSINFTKYSLQYTVWTGSEKKPGEIKAFDVQTQKTF